MSRRTKLQGIFGETAEELATANFEDFDNGTRGPSGPVRSMALTLGKMEEEAKALQEALVQGLRIQDIEPALIDDSFVRDRLGSIELDRDDPLVESIAENGQEVPILVRPHPEASGRYQVAYGHRRLRAARLLGIPVKAVVRKIEDDQLIVAQGVENSARSNLTYIEKAAFAFELENRGFKRALIMKALATDKTELSKMISVASAIPGDVVKQIGKTPSYGRRKWLGFAEVYSDAKRPSLNRLFASDQFIAANSDERFDLALDAIVSKPESVSNTWRPNGSDQLSASYKAGRNSFTLALKASEASGFGQFLAQKLDELYAEFKAIGEK